jgi:hypothetical protein
MSAVLRPIREQPFGLRPTRSGATEIVAALDADAGDDAPEALAVLVEPDAFEELEDGQRLPARRLASDREGLGR